MRPWPGVPPPVDRLPRASPRAGTLVAATLLAAACARTPEPPRWAQAPSVVLITLDALRQDHLSFNGYGRPTSPNLDWLARRAAVFPTIVPTGCSTKASLTSLFVSQGYQHHRIIDHGDVLADRYLTLAEVFRSAGYTTAAFVATPHLLAGMQYDQGFDRYEDFAETGGRAPRLVQADVVVDQALEYLEVRDGSKPFFAYLHFEEAHPPWVHDSPWLVGQDDAMQFHGCARVPLDEEVAAFDETRTANLIARYDGAIRFADEQIGRLVGFLRDRALLRRTIVAVSTDHGIELMDRYSASHGRNPFDEVVKTFLVLYDPRGVPEADTRVQGRIQDIGPTLLGLAGLPVPGDFEGVDLVRDAERLPEFAFAQCYNAEVVRSSTFKLVRVTEVPPSRLARRHLRKGLALYHLADDPGETEDVQERFPEQIRRMETALAGYLADRDRRDLEPEEIPDEELDPQALERLRVLGYVE